MRKPALLTQLLAVNALLIVGTVLATIAAARLELEHVSDRRQAAVLAAGILATVLVNGLVLRRRLAPLERLIEVMEAVDLAEPGRRADVPEADSADVVRLHQAFNRMLDRLEHERSHTGAAVLRAQEEERGRLARDLHDECNQALTGVLLRLQATAQHAPEALRAELRETRELANAAMGELLALARELRPAALDDHGLIAALRSQLRRFTDGSGVETALQVDDPLDDLSEQEQTVVYRIVQESLSNILRHAGARHARVELAREDGAPVVRVVDDGGGFAGVPPNGLGLVGMRERARLVRGRLDVASAPAAGTVVTLRLEGAALEAAA